MVRWEGEVHQLKQGCRRHRRHRLAEGLVRVACWWISALAIGLLNVTGAVAVAALGLLLETIRWHRSWWTDDEAALAADQAGETGGLLRTALAVGRGEARGSSGMGQSVLLRADARVEAAMPGAVQRFRLPWVAFVPVGVVVAVVLTISPNTPAVLGLVMADEAALQPTGTSAEDGADGARRSRRVGGQEDAGTAARGSTVPRALDAQMAATGTRREGAAGAEGGSGTVGAAGSGGDPSIGEAGSSSRTGTLAEHSADVSRDGKDTRGDPRSHADRDGEPGTDAEDIEAVAAGDPGGPRGPVERVKEDIDERMLFADGDFGRDHGDAIGERVSEDLTAAHAPNIEMGMVTMDSDVAAPGIGGVNDSAGVSLALTVAQRLANVEAAEQWVETAWQESGAGTVQTIEGGQSGGKSTLAYQEIFSRYAAIAESAVQTETIPPTRRHYIRRYFQAIRPTEDSRE